MSNIHTASASHGLDDEPNEDGSIHCPSCWSEARRQFFALRYHRRGETLSGLYNQIHDDAHQY